MREILIMFAGIAFTFVLVFLLFVIAYGVAKALDWLFYGDEKN